MVSSTILVIDDEKQIQKFLKVSLEAHGHKTFEALTAARGKEALTSTKPDIVILDLALPDKSGLEVLREIREWNQVPIIILSAKNEEDIIVEALESGADDYLTKPFAMRELLARIQVALRNKKNEKCEELFINGHLEIDFSSRTVKVSGQEISLTSLEYDLLKMLSRHPGKVLTHQQILREVWGNNAANQTQYLRVYITHLRQKIELKPDRPKMIQTETGVGYRMKIINGEHHAV